MTQVQEEDRLFLEAGYDQAALLLDRHIERRREWTVADIREKHEYPRLAYEVWERQKNGEPFDMPDAVTYGLVITLETENGIVWYPRDVGRIYNPFDKKPDENDPYEKFTRLWTGEEFPHGEGLLDCLYLTGYDMKKYEQDRKAFQVSGIIPRPHDSASGVAYTGVQELATSRPYHNLTKVLTESAAASDDKLVREVCAFMIDIVRHVSKDEQLHAAFINGTAKAAFDTNDPQIVSFMMAGIARTIIDFAMPGDGGIPNFKRLAVKAARNKIFTMYDLAEIKYRQIEKTWKVAGRTALNAAGEQDQAKILAYRDDLVAEYPKLAELKLAA